MGVYPPFYPRGAVETLPQETGPSRGRGELARMSRAPASHGLDEGRLRLAWRHVCEGGLRGVYGAAVLGVARHGATAFLDAWGTFAPVSEAKVTPDSLFDLASITKPFVGAALLSMVEDGLLSLEDSLAQTLPDAAGCPAQSVQVCQLATHVSGLPHWRPLYRLASASDALRSVVNAPLLSPPGSRYVYSDLGYILLGEIVARAAGAGLEEVLTRRVFEPLGLKSLRYLPPGSVPVSVVPTGNCEWRPARTLCGEVHDANAWRLGGIAGHAGLFGTAADLLTFGSAMLGMEVGGARLLGPAARRLAQSNQLDWRIGGHSIGWFTHPNRMLPRGDLLSLSAFGHTGFTGTMLVCDPEYGLVVVLLTNRVLLSQDNTGIKGVRRRVLNAVASAVQD